MRQKKKNEFLTEVELELMTPLWDIGEGTVKDVLALLGPDRPLAYTSAATILRIMDDKGFVSSKKRGKMFLYSPTLTKDEYQAKTLRNLSDKLFDGTPAAMVARLVNDEGLTDDALEEIRALLDRRLSGDDD